MIRTHLTSYSKKLTDWVPSISRGVNHSSDNTVDCHNVSEISPTYRLLYVKFPRTMFVKKTDINLVSLACALAPLVPLSSDKGRVITVGLHTLMEY